MSLKHGPQNFYKMGANFTQNFLQKKKKSYILENKHKHNMNIYELHVKLPLYLRSYVVKFQTALTFELSHHLYC
jgi:hypothetical protein